MYWTDECGVNEMIRIFISGTILGIITGSLLFLVLFFIDVMTDIGLVNLLINIDFIYNGDVPFILEFGLHIITSIIISIIFKFIYIRAFYLHLKAHVVAVIIFAGLYFLLKALAVTPIQTETHIGFVLWTIFHIGYLQLIHLTYINQWDSILLNKIGGRA